MLHSTEPCDICNVKSPMLMLHSCNKLPTSIELYIVYIKHKNLFVQTQRHIVGEYVSRSFFFLVQSYYIYLK